MIHTFQRAAITQPVVRHMTASPDFPTSGDVLIDHSGKIRFFLLGILGMNTGRHVKATSNENGQRLIKNKEGLNKNSGKGMKNSHWFF